MKKKNTLFKILAVFMCLACVLPLAACSNDDDESHEFTVLTVKEETVKDYNSMPVFKSLARETKRDVYWVYNTSNQYKNNTDPVGLKGIDAIYHAGFSNLQLYNYGRKGRIVAINKYLKYMPNFSKILEKRPDILEALKSPDGNIYSLPRVEEMGLKAYPNILFLNKKWVKKLIDTNQMPSEVDIGKEDLVDGLKLKRGEFKAILEKFNSLDMDGDGDKNNEVPLSFVGGNWQGNESDLIASFGVPENTDHKTIVDGKVMFTVESENWFNAVKELHEWYKKGLIRSQSFTKTQDEFLAMGQGGRYGPTYGAFYWWEKETVIAKDYHNDYIVLEPLVDDLTGNQYVGVSNELEVEKAECVILEKCKDKAGLLSYFDKFFLPDYSAQLNYGSIESNAFKPQKENGKLIPEPDHGRQSADDFRMKNAPYGIVYLDKEVWEKYVEMEPRAMLRLERLDLYIKKYTFANAVPIPNLNYTKEQLDTLNKYESTLGKNINSWFTTRVTGNSTPTISDWQNNLLKLNATSFEQVRKVNQEAYDNYLKATQNNNGK